MKLSKLRLIVMLSLVVVLSVIITATVLIKCTLSEIDDVQRQSMRFLGHDIAISSIQLSRDQLNEVANSIRSNVGNDKAGDDFMKGYVREWCVRHSSGKTNFADCAINYGIYLEE